MLPIPPPVPPPATAQPALDQGSDASSTRRKVNKLAREMKRLCIGDGTLPLAVATRTRQAAKRARHLCASARSHHFAPDLSTLADDDPSRALSSTSDGASATHNNDAPASAVQELPIGSIAFSSDVPASSADCSSHCTALDDACSRGSTNDHSDDSSFDPNTDLQTTLVSLSCLLTACL